MRGRPDFIRYGHRPLVYVVKCPTCGWHASEVAPIRDGKLQGVPEPQQLGLFAGGGA